MNTNEFEHLMKSLEAGNSGYMCFDRKEDMLFLVARIGRQCQLVDKRDKHVVELVDKDGRMVAFTPEDVSPSVITRDVETGNARALVARYRFFVYELKDGRAEVEWIVCPDGSFFADWDGFGVEDCKELTVKAVINRKGEVLVPFH